MSSEISMTGRISRKMLFMSIAHTFGLRSTCPRAHVGAIAVKEGRIISSGYVGAPAGRPHCSEVGCDMQDGHCVRTVHAEANVVAWAARAGTSLEGTTIYSTHRPCLKCAQLIVNSGVEEVIFDLEYGEADGIMLLHVAGIRVGRSIASEL